MPTSLAESRRDEYTLALVVLHLILIVPFLLRGFFKNNEAYNKTPSLALSWRRFGTRFGPSVLFVLVGVASWILHNVNLDRANVSEEGLWSLIFTDREPWRNSCQSSIDFDVLFTSLLTALLMIFEIAGSTPSLFRTLLSLGFTCAVIYYAVPVLSLGAVFSFYCAARELFLVV